MFSLSVESKRALLALALIPALAACGSSKERREWRASDHAQPPEAVDAPTSTRRLTPEEARAQTSSALFRMHCASCHGAGGLGDGPNGRGLGVPNLADPELATRLSDEALAAVIRDGRGAMPGFGRMIDSAAVEGLVAHIRSLPR